MKKFLLLICMLLPLTMIAQDLILRAGDKVYKFDERKGWSEKPLPVNSILHIGDSIKSYTTFTVESPRSWKNFFKKRVFTYNKCVNGARLTEKLEEKKDCYNRVNTQVILQSENTALIEHLKWIQNNDDTTSPINVEFEIYDSNNWYQIKNDTVIDVSTPVTLSIINNESFSVYTIVLWKDSKWEKIDDRTDECIKIYPFSQFVKTVTLHEPLGKQTVLLICTKIPIPEGDLLSLLKNDHESKYDSNFGETIGFSSVHFNLSK